MCFYPQGIILDYGEKFFSIDPYDFCEKHFGKSQMYSQNTLKLRIKGFDEVHFWVKLSPYITEIAIVWQLLFPFLKRNCFKKRKALLFAKKVLTLSVILKINTR